MRGLKISAAGRTRGDIPLIVCVSLMACFGCLMIYSASSYVGEVQYGDSLYFVKKQLLGVVAGGAAMAFFCFFPYYKLYKFRYAAVVIAAVLLALVFVPGIGVTNYGATRWIGFGSFTIQPSEIAKYAYALFTAAYFAKNYRKVKTVRGVLPVLGVGALFCVLVILEPNMSITMCLGLLMLALVFLSGTNLKTFAFVLIPCALAVPVLIIAEPYRLERLSAFLDPWSSPLDEGYQLIQSFYALGSGGLFGVGLFNSRQKYLFLPFAESDFIFSVIGEELGFVGCAAVLAVFGVIVWRGALIAMRAESRFDCYLAAGITAVIGIQALLNVAVVTGSIPPTGLPLPFVSSGGTSLLMFTCATAVLQRVAAKSQRQAFGHKMY